MATLHARRSPSRAQGKGAQHRTRRHSSSPPARSSSSQTADSSTTLSLRPSATPRTASAGPALQLVGDRLSYQRPYWNSPKRQGWLQNACSQSAQLSRTQSCQPPAVVYEEEGALSKARTLSGVLLPAQIAGTAAAVLIDASFRQASNAKPISSVNGYSPSYGAAATAATAAAVGTATAACTLASSETCGMPPLLSPTAQANHMTDLESSSPKLPVYVATSPFEASATKAATPCNSMVSNPYTSCENLSAMSGINLCSFCGQERPCAPPCPLAVTTAALQFTGIYATGRFRVACFIGSKTPRNSSSAQTSPDTSPTVSSAANQCNLMLDSALGTVWNHPIVEANQQSAAGVVDNGIATPPVQGATDADVTKLNTLLAVSDAAQNETSKTMATAALSTPQRGSPQSSKKVLSCNARIQRKGRFVVVEYDDVVSAAKAAAMAALSSAGDEDGGVAAASAAAAASLHDAASAALAAGNGCCNLDAHMNKPAPQLSTSSALTATAAAAAALSAPLDNIPACASTAAATAAVLEHTAQACAKHALESSTLSIAHNAIAAVVHEQLHAAAAAALNGTTCGSPFDAVLSQAPVLSAMGLSAGTATSQARSSNATSPCVSSILSVSDSSAALSCLSDAATLDTVIRSVAEAVVPHAQHANANDVVLSKMSTGMPVWPGISRGSAASAHLPASGSVTPVHSPVSMSRTSSIMMNDAHTSSPKIQLPASRQLSSVSSRGPPSGSSGQASHAPSATQTPRSYRKGRFSIQEVGPEAMTTSNSFCVTPAGDFEMKADLAHLKSISSSGALDPQISMSAGVAPCKQGVEPQQQMSPPGADTAPRMCDNDRGNSFCRGSSFAYLCSRDPQAEDDDRPSIPTASFACWISDSNDGCGSGCGSQHVMTGSSIVDVSELMNMRKHTRLEEASDACYPTDATSYYEATQQTRRKVTDQLNIFINGPVPPQTDEVSVSSGNENAYATTASQYKSVLSKGSSKPGFGNYRSSLKEQVLGLSQVEQQPGPPSEPSDIKPGTITPHHQAVQQTTLPPISTTGLSCTPTQKMRKVGRFTVVEGH